MSSDNPKDPRQDSSAGGTSHSYPQGDPEYRLVRVSSAPYQDKDDEIDLLELVKTMWDGRRTIIYSVVAFMALGLFVAFGSSEEYTSQVKLMPEVRQEANLGRLGGLARQFGVAGQAQSAEGIPASLYPDVTRSLPLMMLLMEYEVYVARYDTTASLFVYLTEMNRPSPVAIASKYTINLPFTVLGGIRGLFEKEEDEPVQEVLLEDPSPVVQIVRLNRMQWEVIEALRNRIGTSYNEQSGTIEVSVEMPDPEIAAEVAHQVVLFLTDYIKAYRTGKSADNVAFIEGRYEESRQRFEEAQERLARFRDENRGQLTELARTREQRLQSEYDLTFNLYNSMAERLEEARINLQEETPVVNVIEPPAVPDRRSSPRRGLILIVAMIFGGISGLGIVFGKHAMSSFQDRL